MHGSLNQKTITKGDYQRMSNATLTKHSIPQTPSQNQGTTMPIATFLGMENPPKDIPLLLEMLDARIDYNQARYKEVSGKDISYSYRLEMSQGRMTGNITLYVIRQDEDIIESQIKRGQEWLARAGRPNDQDEEDALDNYEYWNNYRH